MSPLITDDELVAMAVSSAVPWRGLLPTVPVTTEELRRAALRGSRSLALRGLDDSALELARLAAASAPLMLVFTAVASSPLIPLSSGVGIFPSPSADVVVDVTLPTGVHEFSMGSRRRGREVLSGLGKQFKEHGSVLGHGHIVTVLLSGSADPGSPVLLVHRDGSTAHRCVRESLGGVAVGPVLSRPDVASAVLVALPDPVPGSRDASVVGSRDGSVSDGAASR